MLYDSTVATKPTAKLSLVDTVARVIAGVHSPMRFESRSPESQAVFLQMAEFALMARETYLQKV